jgi:hypothetical protein
MIKSRYLLLTLPIFSLSAVANSDFSGHRIGLGYNKVTDVTFISDTYTRGTGMKLEYGYDFNHIAGINVSFASHSDSHYGFDLDGMTFRVDSDLGYAFEIDEDFTIKPYGAIGLASLAENYSYLGHSISAHEATIFLGAGVRANIGSHFYTDMRLEWAAYDEVDVDTFSLTFGYKF